MRIVSKTGGVVVCTVSLHAEGSGPYPGRWLKISLELGLESTFRGAY